MLIDVYQAILTNIRLAVGNVANLFEIGGGIGFYLSFAACLTCVWTVISRVISFCSGLVVDFIPVDTTSTLYQTAAYAFSFGTLATVTKVTIYVISYFLGTFYAAYIMLLFIRIVPYLSDFFYKLVHRGTGGQ